MPELLFQIREKLKFHVLLRKSNLFGTDSGGFHPDRQLIWDCFHVSADQRSVTVHAKWSKNQTKPDSEFWISVCHCWWTTRCALLPLSWLNSAPSGQLLPGHRHFPWRGPPSIVNWKRWPLTLVCLACQAIACIEVVPCGPYHQEFLE